MFAPFSSARDCSVALLAEGVDRNTKLWGMGHVVIAVALLAEGVDRNQISCYFRLCSYWSPSSRRAWIEIRRLF